MIVLRGEPVFYDCEATCIGGLPIEIGWAFIEPSTGEIHSESHLVKPSAHWDLNPVWDPDAERLHRISKAELFARGCPPSWIATRMNEQLAGRSLFSDSPVDDRHWLLTIFDEAGLQPEFVIEAINAKVLIAKQVERLSWDAHQIEAAKVAAERRSPRNHRAEADARHLTTSWQIIVQDHSAGDAEVILGARMATWAGRQ